MVRFMMAGRLGEEARPVLDGAPLGIGRAPIEPAQAGEGDRRRAHGAGLERHIEVAADEPLRAQRVAGGADRQNLGMRRRIPQFERPVAGTGQDEAIAQDDRADRHFPARTRGAGLVQGQSHGIDTGEDRLHPALVRQIKPLCNFGRAMR